MKTFREKVYQVVSKIPQGKTLSYKEVARRAGSPKASRAVGSALKKNKDSYVPCHRVIREDGSIGGYKKEEKKKRKKLQEEKAL